MKRTPFEEAFDFSVPFLGLVLSSPLCVVFSLQEGSWQWRMTLLSNQVSNLRLSSKGVNMQFMPITLRENPDEIHTYFKQLKSWLSKARIVYDFHWAALNHAAVLVQANGGVLWWK